MATIARLCFILSLALTLLSTQTLTQVQSGPQTQVQTLPPVFTVAPLITDNMVLQQKSNAPLWGYGVPGTQVSVLASWGDSGKSVVEANGAWMVKVKTPKAGGPFTMTIRHGDSTRTIANVLSGEVWLCSGQSNMEMPLMGWPPRDTVQNGVAEISGANFPNLRLCTVRRAFSAIPESTCNASWVECSPATVPQFSATAFFFGKKLMESLGVPVGLIHSSWGGTPAEAWISGKSLATIPDFAKSLEGLKDCPEGVRRLREWLHKYPAIDMQGRSGDDRWRALSFGDSLCGDRVYPDSTWSVMQLPRYWESTEMGNFDGAVWFRKSITIPAGWRGTNLVLELGPIDDMDVTFVNGARVGGYDTEGFWSTKRVYSVPGTLVDSAVMQIAIRVLDNQGGGGIYGGDIRMHIRTEAPGDTVFLAGDWKYLPVAELSGNVLYVFGPSGQQYITRPRMSVDFSASTPTTLYNGMIAPLVPYAIRGAIWYQGEANVDRPKQYRTLLPLLIENWRKDFGVGDFPFYFVQIAPFDYGQGQSQYLREAQLATMAVKNTGMVVTLDIGNAKNIHPMNKTDVGGRLALWALAKTYGQNIPCSGPVYTSSKKLKGSIELSFDQVGKGLVVKPSAGGSGFQIAGADRIFKEAVVKVRGKTLIVSAPDVAKPVAVRYAFSNTPEATLFNAAGLPASSFRTDDWE
jgi:sialate O-acetylesterase